MENVCSDPLPRFQAIHTCGTGVFEIYFLLSLHTKQIALPSAVFFHAAVKYDKVIVFYGHLKEHSSKLSLFSSVAMTRNNRTSLHFKPTIMLINAVSPVS